MLFYAITGTVELGQMAQILTEDGFLSIDNYSNYIMVLFAFVFMFAAIGF